RNPDLGVPHDPKPRLAVRHRNFEIEGVLRPEVPFPWQNQYDMFGRDMADIRGCATCPVSEHDARFSPVWSRCGLGEGPCHYLDGVPARITKDTHFKADVAGRVDSRVPLSFPVGPGMQGKERRCSGR